MTIQPFIPDGPAMVPGDIRTVDQSLSDEIAANYPTATVTSVSGSVTPAGLAITAITVDSSSTGALITLSASGATVGVNYRVTTTFTLSNAQVLNRSFNIPVVSAHG